MNENKNNKQQYGQSDHLIKKKHEFYLQYKHIKDVTISHSSCTCDTNKLNTNQQADPGPLL